MSELSEIDAALDAAGCPTGNEHEVYDQVHRIAGLHKTRDFAWKQMDELRDKLKVATDALTECATPKGAFRQDPLEHAKNIIEETARIAQEALTKLKS